MHPWHCALLICVAGATGGFVSALISANGFALPRRIQGVWCPGAASTVIAGAFAAFASWALYGSGAGLNLADSSAVISLQFSALAGAFMVGVVGAKWITNEADKRLLKEVARVAATKDLAAERANQILDGPALDVLQKMSAI